MKKVILLSLLLGLVACDDAGAARDSPKPSASPSASADAPAKPAAKPTSAAMSHDEVLKKGSALEGKPVTVNAVSWGVSKRTDGVQVNLGPDKLSGMRQSKLVAFFPKGPEQERFDGMKDAVKKDAEVTLLCKGGGKSYGARRLLECKLP